MPFYAKGDVRIRYEEAGSGFPLLVMPGGGFVAGPCRRRFSHPRSLHSHMADTTP